MDPETVKQLRITGIGIVAAALLTTCVFGRKAVSPPSDATPPSATTATSPAAAPASAPTPSGR